MKHFFIRSAVIFSNNIFIFPFKWGLPFYSVFYTKVQLQPNEAFWFLSKWNLSGAGLRQYFGLLRSESSFMVNFEVIGFASWWAWNRFWNYKFFRKMKMPFLSQLWCFLSCSLFTCPVIKIGCWEHLPQVSAKRKQSRFSSRSSASISIAPWSGLAELICST